MLNLIMQPLAIWGMAMTFKLISFTLWLKSHINSHKWRVKTSVVQYLCTCRWRLEVCHCGSYVAVILRHGIRRGNTTSCNISYRTRRSVPSGLMLASWKSCHSGRESTQSDCKPLSSLSCHPVIPLKQGLCTDDSISPELTWSVNNTGIQGILTDISSPSG